ncbi:MAG: VWA domain-containing protein [Chlorobaculum sp.]|jgi:Ca-activated chloride channel homolog|nr:VWA domain-containing protein [Chlorobaculum sp.]
MNSLLSILTGIRFDNPWWLLLLPLAVGGSVAYRLLWRKNRPGVLFPSVLALRSAGFAALSLFSKFPEWLHWLVLVLIVLALSGPRAPFPPSTRDTVGIDIMIALDVSASMNTPDFGGKSRFTGARDAAMRFIDNRPADRIGLVVFSGGSFTRCPLTLDHEVLERLSETLSPGFLDEPGTAIGTAILTATNRLKASPSKEKALVLITDGENNAGEVTPETAARLAANYGIRVYTVLASRESGLFDSGKKADLNLKGRSELETVARISGGRMFTAGDMFGLMKSFRDIDRLEKTRLKGRMPARTMELYPGLLMAAVLLLITEQALSATRFIRIP